MSSNNFNSRNFNNKFSKVFQPEATQPEATQISFHPALQTLMDEYKSNKSGSSLPPSDITKPSTNKKRTNGTVDPISNPADIQIAKEYFLNRAVRYSNNPNNIRDYALFVVGINSARRIGDIVTLKVSDLFYPDYSWRKYWSIKEQKTKKPIKILINDSVKTAVSMLLSSMKNHTMDTYLFQSREGINQPIETRSVHHILKEMSKMTGLDKKYNIGTHSMRKTWARNYYVNHPTEIVKIQKALNHSSPGVTLRYIGIEQEEMNEMFSECL